MEEGVGSSAIVTADKQQKVEEQNLLVRNISNIQLAFFVTLIVKMYCK